MSIWNSFDSESGIHVSDVIVTVSVLGSSESDSSGLFSMSFKIDKETHLRDLPGVFIFQISEIFVGQILEFLGVDSSSNSGQNHANWAVVVLLPLLQGLGADVLERFGGSERALAQARSLKD